MKLGLRCKKSSEQRHVGPSSANADDTLQWRARMQKTPLGALWCRLGGEWGRHMVTTAIVLLGVCGLFACGVAASRPVNSASTDTYLSARKVREEALEKGAPSSRSAAERYVDGAATRCPGIVAHAPRSREFGELTYEAFLAVTITLEQANSEALAKFAAMTQHLDWNERRLTVLVRRLAQEERQVARIVPPDLCDEFAEWGRSGYQTIPVTARRFQDGANALARMRVATSSEQAPHGKLVGCRRLRPHARAVCSVRNPQTLIDKEGNTSSSKPTSAIIWRLLKPYEHGEQQRIARETEQLEASLRAKTNGILTSTMAVLAHSLGLDPAVVPLILEGNI